MWLLQIVFLSCFQYGTQTNLPLQLMSAITLEEMNDCSLFLAYESGVVSDSILQVVHELPYGAITAELKQDTKADDLLQIKSNFQTLERKFCINYIVIMHDLNSTKILLESGKEFWMGRQKLMICIMTPMEQSFIDMILSNKVFSKSSNMVLVNKALNREAWEIYSLVLYKGKYRQSSQQLNSWTSKSRFKNKNKVFEFNKYKNFNNYNFTIAALPWSPFLIMENESSNGPDRFSGLEMELLNMLSDTANFSYFFTVPKEYEWGVKLSNGTWTGLIGIVGSERADVAMCDVGLTYLRMPYVDYSQIYVYDFSELVTPNAKNLPLWQGPFKPFSMIVWLGVLLSWVTVAISLFLISSTVNLYKTDLWFSSMSNCFFFSILPLLNRGLNKDYKKSSGRLFMLMWLLTAMVLSMFYTSSLTSFLIEPGKTKPIQNFEELIESDLNLELMDFGGYLKQGLEAATTPIGLALNKMVKWIKPDNFTLSTIVHGTAATFHGSISIRKDVAEKFTDKYGQPLVFFTKESFSKEYVAWPFIKLAPYKDRFDDMIIRIVESGVIDKLLRDTIYNESRKVEKTNDDQDPDQATPTLTMAHCQGPFFLLGAGFIVAFFALLLEICVGKFIISKNVEKF